MRRIASNLDSMRTLLFTIILLLANSVNSQSFEYIIPIENSFDDAEQEGSFVDVNDLELDLGYSNGEQSLIGLYFRSISMDAGSSVDSAVLLLTLQQDFDSALTVNILLENEANPSSYLDTITLKENRTFYAETISWTIPAGFKGDQIASPNLSSLMNKILNKNDWSPTSGVNFIIEPADLATDSFSNETQIYSYDQSQPSRRPQLMLVTDSANINGISDYQLHPSISIYPNPASDIIIIEGIDTPFQVAIFNLNGQLICRQENGHNQLDLSNFEPGVYFVSVRIDETNKTFKLIKEGY